MQDGESACIEQHQQAKQCSVAWTDNPSKKWLLLVGQLALWLLVDALVLCSFGIVILHPCLRLSLEASYSWPNCCLVVGWLGDPGTVLALCIVPLFFCMSSFATLVQTFQVIDISLTRVDNLKGSHVGGRIHLCVHTTVKWGHGSWVYVGF